MDISIINVKLEKNPVSVNEKVQISVMIIEHAQESAIRRLPFRLGQYRSIRI